MTGALVSSVGAQERIRYDTVTVEQRILLTSDITPAQARRRGIEEALAEAVRQVSGVLVRSGIVAVKEEQSGRIRDDYFSVVQLDAVGRATSYDIVDEGWVTTRHPELGEQVYLRLAVRSTIATELTATDAGFTVDAWAASSLLRVRGRNPAQNDELVIGVRSSRPAWLTVLTVDGDSAAVLFPNDYVREVRIEAGDSIQVPAEEWRARGLRLRAELPTGVYFRRELVVVVATREVPPPFKGRNTMDLQRWLLTIPVEQRALKWLVIDTRSWGSESTLTPSGG